MKRNEDFRKALGQPDDAFQNTVMDTLNQLNREAMASARPQRRISLRLACTFAALVLLCVGTVLTRYGVSGFLKGQPDSRTDPSVPVETAFIPLTASGAAAVVPGGVLADCELATITLKEAITDGLGVSLTVEAQPKHEHSLVLDESIDVHMESPDIIGKTPDYIGQTIMQWAKDHGYQEVLMMHLFTPANETDRTSTSDANIQSLRESFVLQDNGSSLIRLAGGALPDTDTYDLYWQVVPWDMEGQNTYTDIPNGRQISYALLGDKVEDGWTKVTVSPTGETPELMGEYTLIYRMGDNQMDIRRFTSVNFYRTSLSDYCEVRTTFNPLLNLHAVELCRDQEQTSAFGCSDYRIRYHHKEEDGSSVTRLALSIPEKIPDRLWLLMDDPKSPDWETTPPDSYMIINKNEEDQPENSGTAETDLVTLTVKEAVTDGLAVYTTVEVRPKDEHTLVLGYLRPYDASPYSIGKIPDSDDQTIMQWAKAHGYRNVLFTTSFYPVENEEQSHDPGYAQYPDFQEDGSVLFRTIFRAAPDMETWNDFWDIAEWDMEQESNDSNHVSFESDQTRDVILQYAISQTPEAPELLASYNLILENGEPAENTLVSLYHTSLSDYCEVRTTDEQMSKLAITELSRKYTPYAGLDRDSFEFHYKEADGTFVTRISGTLPRNLPDDLQLTMAGPYYLEWNLQTSHTFPLVKTEDTVPQAKEPSPDELAPILAAAKTDGDYPTVLTIDKGSAEGLKAGQAVMYNEALIGIIAEVREHDATVRTILDPDARIACVIQAASRSQGVLKRTAGENTAPGSTPLYRIEFLPDDASVAAGDPVVTSGAALLPAGIPIGTVTAIGTDPETDKRYAVVEPLADFRNLNTMIVFRFTPESLSSGRN